MTDYDDHVTREPAPVCEREFIDGSWYGDDCPDCRWEVSREAGDCENCADEDGYCSKHENGIYS